jgi:TolA-binding protein
MAADTERAGGADILTGSLAAGLLIALVLAGLAYWQRGIAVQERQIADQQRQRAEDTLAAATGTANSLVFDLAQQFRHTMGIPAELVKDILGRARALQEQLTKSNQVTPELKRSEAAARWWQDRAARRHCRDRSERGAVQRRDCRGRSPRHLADGAR